MTQSERREALGERAVEIKGIKDELDEGICPADGVGGAWNDRGGQFLRDGCT